MAVTESEIVIGAGVLGGEILARREDRARVAILTQEGATGIAGAIRRALAADGLMAEVITLPDGEDAKSLTVAEDCFVELNRLGLTRYDTVLAVGGGTVTDLGGFVAATYLRGIEAVYCPTTLLGAVDAAIGGKTGVNVGGKNLVGAFAHPSRIIIDLEVLDALPTALRRQGMAEALKAGLVGDIELVAVLERDGIEADTGEVVRRAVAVKTAVVGADFREFGRRAVLNYGHTIGHAIEVVTGLSHGEAIAIGMVAAGAVSSRLAGFGEEARVVGIVERLELPTRAIGNLDLDRVRDLIKLDKKRDAGGLRMVLLEAVGNPVLRTVDDEAIEIGLAVVE